MNQKIPTENNENASQDLSKQEMKNKTEFLSIFKQDALFIDEIKRALYPIRPEKYNPIKKPKCLIEDSESDDDDNSIDSKGLPHSLRSSIHFQIISQSTISIEFEPPTSITPELQKIIENHKGSFENDINLWMIPFEEYYQIHEEFLMFRKTFNVIKIHKIALQFHSQFNSTLLCFTDENKRMVQLSYKDPKEATKSLSQLPITLQKGLYGFQKDGVLFGLHKHGRVLLADEMGIGKTIQAISICSLYRENWPVLIICPGSVKYQWRNEIMRWLRDIMSNEIQMINSSKVKINSMALFYIITYDLVKNIYKKLERKNFQFVILDESHNIKNKDCQRSECIVPIAQKAKRIILISGTPLLAKPLDGFTALTILRPDIFTNFTDYGNRYCDPRPTPFGLNWSGASNTKELHYIINTLMIRRLKKDVLDELPPKHRMKLVIPCDRSALQEMQKLKTNKKDSVAAMYQLTGHAKIKGIKNYVQDLLASDTKFIIFAHHQKILDEIEKTVQNAKIKYIRIDGRVKIDERFNRVQEFQNNPRCKVAILSINAAATGITLTEASHVVFAELTWTPAIMIQAEDRAHRIGQKADSLNIVYLFGKNTLDEFIFSKLELKLKIVSTTIDDIQGDWAFKQNNNKKIINDDDSDEDDDDDDDYSSDLSTLLTNGYQEKISKDMVVLCKNSLDKEITSVSTCSELNFDINLHEKNTRRPRQFESKSLLNDENAEFNLIQRPKQNFFN